MKTAEDMRDWDYGQQVQYLIRCQLTFAQAKRIIEIKEKYKAMIESKEGT